MKNKYTFNIKVTKNDIDFLDHVNNVIYVNWILEAAQKHWEHLSSEMLNSKYVWVVLKHEIDYLAAAKLNDEITICTWVENSYGPKSTRVVEIYKGAKLLVSANTIWCLLDKPTMKPIRIPSLIIDLFN